MIKDNGFIPQSNRKPIEDFEGFTPTEMHGLLYYPFDTDKSPFRLCADTDPQIFDKAYFFKDILQYLHLVRDRQPMKLTQKGNLPMKFCRELAKKKVLEKDRFWFENRSITKEEDSYYISLLNIITRQAGLTKKRNGKMTLTKICMRYLDMPSGELFRHIFITYTRKFNWAFSDGYPDSWIIQGGFALSIFFVQKYGMKSMSAEFYADKYLKAFPSVIRDFSNLKFGTAEEGFRRCYYLRAFERFLLRFGFIEIRDKGTLVSKNPDIKKTKLIDDIVKWEKA